MSFGRDHQPKGGLAPDFQNEFIFIHTIAQVIFIDGFSNTGIKISAIYNFMYRG